MSPEELIRQKVLLHLIEDLGYPKQLIVIEKQLSTLISTENIPDRRIDILCYTNAFPEIEMLIPLLMIECKAENISKKAIAQALGYNYYVKAHFISVVSKKAALTGWVDSKTQQYQFQNGFFSYDELCTKIMLQH